MLVLLALACTGSPDTPDTPDETETGPVDEDGDGYDADIDCDDLNPASNPGAVEICDGLDNNCNGVVDDSPSDATWWYADVDGDGYGDSSTAQQLCDGPPDWVDNGDDCDDADASVNPEATEVCDGVDQDCDGTADDGTGTTLYADRDEDGYGSPDDVLISCEGEEEGYLEDDSDCDDQDDEINPDAVDVCGDGVDQDCDDADATCSWLGDASDEAGHAITTWSGGEAVQILGDWDGDGDVEIAIGDHGKTKDLDGNWLFDTGTNGEDYPGSVKIYAWDGTSLEPEAFIEGHSDGEAFGTTLVEADVTNDGVTDLLVSDYLWDDGDGCAYLYEGPVSAGTTSAGVADRRLCGPTFTGADMAAADTNGDGVSDWIIASPGNPGDDWEVSVWFISGPVTTAGGEGSPSDVAEGHYLGRWDSVLMVGQVGSAGDLDGDGDDEVVVGTGLNHMVLDDPGSSSLDLTDDYLAIVVLDDSDAGIDTSRERDLLGADVNDDGTPDLLVSSEDRIYVFAGPVDGELGADDAESVLVNETGAYMNRLSVADMDGDGVLDVWVGSAKDSSGTSDGGAAFLFYGPLSGTQHEYDAGAVIRGSSDGHRFGNALDAGPDVNGDGVPDLAVVAPHDQGGDPGVGAALYLFTGL